MEAIAHEKWKKDSPATYLLKAWTHNVIDKAPPWENVERIVEKPLESEM